MAPFTSLSSVFVSLFVSASLHGKLNHSGPVLLIMFLEYIAGFYTLLFFTAVYLAFRRGCPLHPIVKGLMAALYVISTAYLFLQLAHDYRAFVVDKNVEEACLYGSDNALVILALGVVNVSSVSSFNAGWT